MSGLRMSSVSRAKGGRLRTALLASASMSLVLLALSPALAAWVGEQGTNFPAGPASAGIISVAVTGRLYALGPPGALPAISAEGDGGRRTVPHIAVSPAACATTGAAIQTFEPRLPVAAHAARTC